MKEPNDIFTEIGEGIQWYFDNSSKASPVALLEFQDKMVGYSFWLGELLVNAKTDYNLKFFSKKMSLSRSTQSFIKSKDMAVNKATLEAIIANEDIIKLEIEAESHAYRCEVLLKQLNKVLDTVRQRISYLKQEKQNSNTQV